MRACFAATALVLKLMILPALGQTPAERLIAAYPEYVAKADGNDLVWRDGTRMPLDDGRGAKSFEQWLAAPDLKDMFRFPYPVGEAPPPVSLETDPGRARNHALFAKMYGDCGKGEVANNLVEVVWLPKKAGQKLRFSKVNGAAERLQRVSRELDALPPSFDSYLIPSEGTYNCRVIAGTSQRSAHGYGIAIDIATRSADYWRWSKGGLAYKNRIPLEIVKIFERHGFIWGGKWGHYDTMHFEYRPEMFAPAPKS